LKLLPECVFILDTGTNATLSKQESTQIFREGKLHIIGVTDGFIESLSPIQVSFMEYLFRIDVVPDNFPILQEGILGTGFLKDIAPIDIRYDMQGFLKWHGIRVMYKIGYCFDPL